MLDPTPTILRHFDTLKYVPPKGRFTVLAAFYLVDENQDKRVTVISIGTGTKCLATKNYSKTGDVVHDFHAEVLARRGVVRWFLQEMAKESEWFVVDDSGERSLRQGITLHMYISELPCGEASTRAIAHLQSLSDPRMALLKSQPSIDTSRTSQTPARGREGYELLNQVRTKPGRADAPVTNAMSCSDKISLWCGIGIQGALLVSLGLQPIYIDTIVIGSIQGVDSMHNIQKALLDDCHRAFSGRLGDLTLGDGYHIHSPRIIFTAGVFEHGRTNIPERTSCNEAMSWIASEPGVEVLVNGIRRGTLPKNRSLPALRPRICKASFFALYRYALQRQAESQRPEIREITYHAAKHSTYDSHSCAQARTLAYHTAKEQLCGIGGPLQGWVVCTEDYEMFVNTE